MHKLDDSIFNLIDGVLSHHSPLSGYTGPGTTWAKEMTFGMNHAPGVRLIA